MNKPFNVLVYPVVRVKVPGIQAENAREAAAKALAILDETTLGRLLNRTFPAGEVASLSEYSEQIESILVDELDPKGNVISETNLDRGGRVEVLTEASHAVYTLEDWRQEVSEGNTQRGYWDWVSSRAEEAKEQAMDAGEASDRG